MDAEVKEAPQPVIPGQGPGADELLRQSETTRAPGAWSRAASRLETIANRPAAWYLLGAAAAVGGSFGVYVNLSNALSASSPVQFASSVAFLVIWSLVAVAGLLILVSNLLAGKEKGGPGKESPR